MDIYSWTCCIFCLCSWSCIASCLPSFRNIISVICTRDIVYTVCHVLRTSLWFSFHEWTPEGMFCFKDCSDII
jgi:hypothetical protein